MYTQLSPIRCVLHFTAVSHIIPYFFSPLTQICFPSPSFLKSPVVTIKISYSYHCPSMSPPPLPPNFPEIIGNVFRPFFSIFFSCAVVLEAASRLTYLWLPHFPTECGFPQFPWRLSHYPFSNTIAQCVDSPSGALLVFACTPSFSFSLETLPKTVCQELSGQDGYEWVVDLLPLLGCPSQLGQIQLRSTCGIPAESCPVQLTAQRFFPSPSSDQFLGGFTAFHRFKVYFSPRPALFIEFSSPFNDFFPFSFDSTIPLPMDPWFLDLDGRLGHHLTLRPDSLPIMTVPLFLGAPFRTGDHFFPLQRSPPF